MKKIFIIGCALSITFFSYAQSYRLADLELALIQHNYTLLAQKYNVEEAEAQRIQARVWNNPTLHIDEVNLWKTYDIEQQGRILGGYGKNQQLSVALEQLIETAGKRRKRIALSEAQVEQGKLAYEDLVLELKWNLRRAYIQLYQIKQEEELLVNTMQRFKDLLQHYNRQSEKQYVAKTEVYRIQSELMGLQKEQALLEGQKQEVIQQLMVLTQINDLSLSQLHFDFIPSALSQHIPPTYITEALKSNLKARLQVHEVIITEQRLNIEKAARVPDLTLGINYDRGGNIMKDFVGVGVAFDIPLFNRNKGNIKAVQIATEREKKQKEAIDMELEQTLITLHRLLLHYETALDQWSPENQLDAHDLLNNYTKHLQNRQITLMEFIDFTQSFREAQSAYWELLTHYWNTYEELQYLSGKDF